MLYEGGYAGTTGEMGYDRKDIYIELRLLFPDTRVETVEALVST